VQVSYLGYPAITGLETIDYRLTDADADPPQPTDSASPEKLFRLPATAWCYEPAPEAPAALDTRVHRSDQITFGSFNNFTKMNPPLAKHWAEILNRVPGSRLLLKAVALNCESVRENLRKMMKTAGIEADRLSLHGSVPIAEHFAMYQQMDIALDTYPYHGTTTTCEALWMGVPVVTLAGDRHVSRVGVSLLSNVGLQELIASNPAQCIQIAVDLANDPTRLDQLRASLRQRMLASPLMDVPVFARGVEAAFRQMWMSWCEATSQAR
jgi:predicted O-linked N-acetylglucosamine transferase (SPINDLY family)